MGIWSQAAELAAATPPERNRYADFLRAASIMFVIIGHWLITTAHYDADTGSLTPILALDVLPWTNWLTWVFQVMPIFFIVGGYSNAISLEGARKKNASYAQWLAGRLHRLLTPLMLLVFTWACMALALNLWGVEPDTITFLSRTALVPTWFLAIYTMIVLLAPATYRLWQRWGYRSLAGYILLAIAADVAFFQLDMQWLGWTNYFWVWLVMHHLGFAWRDGRAGSPALLLALAVLSFATLVALIALGPYPVAMAGSPGDEVSNTLPPKITLLALGLAQFGVLLSVEKPAQRLLERLRLWTAVVIVNTMIMTVYLWHMTVLLLVLATSYYMQGFGMTTAPGTTQWWATRPVWLVVLATLLVPFALALSPLERMSGARDATPPAAWRLIGGAMMIGAGITLATLLGFDGELVSVTNTGIIALVLAGAVVCRLPIRQLVTRLT